MSKETLTKENFWDEMEQKYPKAMAHFKQWIDQYKRDNNWGYVFNPEFTIKTISERGNFSSLTHSWPPKYHELPIAMQFGIFTEYLYYTDTISIDLFSQADYCRYIRSAIENGLASINSYIKEGKL